MRSILVAALAAGIGWIGQQDRGADRSLEFRFIGNAAVAMSDGRQTIVTDFPYQSGYSGYMTFEASAAPTGNVTSLITHAHRDHFDSDAFLRTNWRIVGGQSVTARVPAERIIPLAQPTTVGDARITPIATPHARIEHHSYLVRWGGRTAYYVGDTEDPDELIKQRGLDVAFVTPWLLRTIETRRLKIDARSIVVYHHQAGESVPRCERCTTPQQNSVFRLPFLEGAR
jgi:hypothetical protein